MGQKEKIQVKNIADLEVLLINDIRIKYGIQVFLKYFNEKKWN